MTTNAEIQAQIEGQNVPKRFLATVAECGDTEVVRWKNGAGEWEAVTASELAETTARVASGLADLGVGPGDRVMIMVANRMEFYPLDLAALFLGATPVSIYNSSAPEQIDYLVNHAKAKVAIVNDADYLAKFEAVRDKLPTLEHIAVIDADGCGDDVVRYADLAAHEPADLDELSNRAELDDLATLIYTSGTTGNPKGVMLTHRNVCWTLSSTNEVLENETDIGSLQGKRHISYLPMAHIFERLVGHYMMIDHAMTVSCCPDTSQIAAYLGEIQPHLFIGVPRVWEKLYAGVHGALAGDPERAGQFNDAVAAAQPIVEKMTAGTATAEEIETFEFLDAVAFSQVRPLIGMSEVQWAVTGAAPIPPEILTWFRSIGVPLTEGYGMSETTAMCTWANAAKAGFVGRPAPGVELKLGEDGEVLVRGGNMFTGYLDEPEKTAETLDDEGFVHTGDIGEIDEDGYLKIVDRKKELIITAGGKNVSPANLEAALKMIPLVGQACAIGDQKPFISALVVLDPDAAAAWAAKHGLDGDAATPQALAENPEVIAEVDAGLATAMAEFNNAEAVKKVTVLGDEWMPDSEVLTPTSKLKRRGIHKTFESAIDAMYAK